MSLPIESILRSKKLRVTTGRVRVLREMIKGNSAVTHGELEERCGGDFDRVTLYRILDSFHESGIIHRFHDIVGETRYALCEFGECDHAHVHDDHMHHWGEDQLQMVLHLHCL